MALVAYTEIKGALFTKKYKEVPLDNINKKKAEKQIAKEKLTVNPGTANYNADYGSISYMSAVVALGNQKLNYLKTITNPVTDVLFTHTEAYNEVFINTLVNWKDADNTVQVINIEEIANVLNLSMTSTASIIGV